MITTRQSMAPNGVDGKLQVRIRDVTATFQSDLELDPRLSVGAVAAGVAASMSLPTDTRWSLRDEYTAAFLSDDDAIGDAVGSDVRASLVLTPQAHLG